MAVQKSLQWRSAWAEQLMVSICGGMSKLRSPAVTLWSGASWEAKHPARCSGWKCLKETTLSYLQVSFSLHWYFFSINLDPYCNFCGFFLQDISNQVGDIHSIFMDAQIMGTNYWRHRLDTLKSAVSLFTEKNFSLKIFYIFVCLMKMHLITEERKNWSQD